MTTIKTRYRLIRRGIRSNAFYCVDTQTGRLASLRTASEDKARQTVEAKNQAERQPVLNLQIAKAHLAGTDIGDKTRTWQQPDETIKSFGKQQTLSGESLKPSLSRAQGDKMTR